MAEQFKQWKAEREDTLENKVFVNFNKRKGADMLKADLEVAGIPYKDEAGRYVDFHALRHTFVSSLSKSGVSPKVAQSLARHSTIGLTMDTYTHIGLYDERAALEKLPELPDIDENKNKGNKAVALKTGTDGLPIEESKTMYKRVYIEFAKKDYPDSNHSLPVGILKTPELQSKVKTDSVDKTLSGGQLGTNSNLISSVDPPKEVKWAG